MRRPLRAADLTPPIGDARTDESPTIISSTRPRTAFDAMLAGTFAGRTLGHFELLEIVGSGGMAAVLKARDLDLSRIVALKILPPEMAVDPENVERFKQEARAAAKLDHDNIARVYHCGEDQGLHFIAFEFVEGDNLRQRMEACGGKIPVREAVTLMYQVSRGLAHASERGVVHRDIKPSNIIITPEGNAKVVDMGLARSLDARVGGQLTHSGVTLGTFDYISPEQAIEPRLADVRSDIYSLGCTFYHLLSGHAPVPEGTVARKLDAHKNLTPPDVRTYNPEVPAELAAVINRMMAKDPAQRYQHPDVAAGQLRDLARKMGVTVERVAEGTRFAEAAPRGRLNISLMVAAGVAMLAVLVGLQVYERMHPAKNDRPVAELPKSQPTSDGPDKKVDGQDKKEPDKKDPPEKKDPHPSGAREAQTVGDLLALLKQGAERIRLTGPEYDLTRYADKDGQPAEALFAGENLRLEGVGQPTVRLAFTPPGKARPRAMTLRGPGGGKGALTIRNVRFQFPAADGDPENAGLLVAAFGRVTVEACTFTSSFKGGRDGRDGPAELAVDAAGAAVTLSQCYFAPGPVGVRLDAQAHLTATECAFAPHHAAVRVTKDDDETVDSEVVFKNCSALLTAGALVEVADGAGCAVQAGHCIFGGMEQYSPFSPKSALLRQRGGRAAGTRYEPANLDEDGSPMANAYQNVAPYAEGEDFFTFAECARAGIPVRDADRALVKSPWQEKDPLAFLVGGAADPKRAFAPNLKLAALRVPGTNLDMLGARYLGTTPLYGLPLQPPDLEPRDATVKVWDPALPAFPPVAGTYPTLKKALADMRRGDTLLIRHNGRLEVDPCEFDKPDTDITVKPDANFRPILVPAPATLKRSPAMFKLFGGRLVLDGLHVRLLPDRVPALAVLPGGGTFEFRNGVITFEAGEDDFAAVTLSDPRGEMMMAGTGPAERWPIPRITVENTVVRGRGRLFNVQGSRPFEADVKNTLAVLDGTLLDIYPSAGDPSAAGSSVVRLHRVTYCGTGPAVHLRASEKKTEPATGLARTDLTVTNCVILPPADAREALVVAERFDDREAVQRWFTWKGKHNAFHLDKKRPAVEIRPADAAANPVKVIEADHWAEIDADEGDPLAAVTTDAAPPRPAAFAGARPADFKIKAVTPKLPDRPIAELGAPPETLPKLYPDE